MPEPTTAERIRRALVTGALTALTAVLLRAALGASLDEVVPTSMLLLAAAAWIASRAAGSTEVEQTFSLGILLALPAIVPAEVVGGALGVVSDASCGEVDRWMADRALSILLAPVSWAPGGGFAAGAVASLVAPRLDRWASIVGWSRRIAVGLAAVALGIAAIGAAIRPGAEAYLATRPVIATLFPTDEPAAPAGDLPPLVAGPLTVHRWCPGASGPCTIAAGTTGKWHLGCADRRSRVELRRAEEVGLFLVDDGVRRYGFRLDPSRSAGIAAVRLARADLLRATRPPIGWIAGALLGLALALQATRARPRVLAADLRALAAAALALILLAPWLAAASAR